MAILALRVLETRKKLRVTELASEVGLDKSGVSRHLRKLKFVGVLAEDDRQIVRGPKADFYLERWGLLSPRL